MTTIISNYIHTRYTLGKIEYWVNSKFQTQRKEHYWVNFLPPLQRLRPRFTIPQFLVLKNVNLILFEDKPKDFAQEYTETYLDEWEQKSLKVNKFNNRHYLIDLFNPKTISLTDGELYSLRVILFSDTVKTKKSSLTQHYSELEEGFIQQLL